MYDTIILSKGRSLPYYYFLRPRSWKEVASMSVKLRNVLTYLGKTGQLLTIVADAGERIMYLFRD